MAKGPSDRAGAAGQAPVSADLQHRRADDAEGDDAHLLFGFLPACKLLGPLTITANLCPFFCQPSMKRAGSTDRQRLSRQFFVSLISDASLVLAVVMLFNRRRQSA